MDGATITAIISAVVAVGGTAITAWNGGLDRKTNSSDKRLDLAFQTQQNLIDDLQSERTDLLQRIVSLEASRDSLEASREESARDREHLRELLRQQAVELTVLRQREADIRDWSKAIMGWAAMAVVIIRGMGGTIEDPPAPPPMTAAA